VPENEFPTTEKVTLRRLLSPQIDIEGDPLADAYGFGFDFAVGLPVHEPAEIAVELALDPEFACVGPVRLSPSSHPGKRPRGAATDSPIYVCGAQAF
jgi:hypothetical protein